MAVDQAFQHNCNHCKAVLNSASYFQCAQCGRLQPLRADENYFLAFGIAPRLKLNQLDLEKRFYELSRALHPDHFRTSDPETQRISMERMTFVNDAYRTLKNPSARRLYFLKIQGFLTTPEKSTPRIPIELAETWFEVQDALSEAPDQATAKLQNFEAELRTFRNQKLEKLAAIEEKIDALLANSSSIADLAAQLISETSSDTYLESLVQDIERIKRRV